MAMASSGDSDEIKQAWRQRAMASGGDGDENEEQSLALGAAWRQRGKDGRRVLWTERAGALASLLIPRGGVYARVLQDPDLIELIVRCDPRHPIADIHRRLWAAFNVMRYKYALYRELRRTGGWYRELLLWLVSVYDEAVRYYWGHIVRGARCTELSLRGKKYPSKNIFLRRIQMAYLFPRTSLFPRIFQRGPPLQCWKLCDCFLRRCFHEMRARGHLCEGVGTGPDDHFDMAVRLTFVNYPFSWHQANSQHVIPFIDLPPG
jgi:hypothetical protein